MASKFTRAKDTLLMISLEPVDALPVGAVDDADFASISCTMKTYSRSGGQRQETDVSTFCSQVVEKDFGLKDNGTATFGGNYFDGDEGQDLLREAEETGDRYMFRVIDSRNREARYIGLVTQTSEEASQGGVWNSNFSIAIVSEIQRLAYVPTPAPSTPPSTPPSSV